MKNIARYFYEMGQLKRAKRAGWWTAGIGQPESIAEHSFRVAIIGYMLAHLEGADPNKTATICLFHDTPETRINDLHRVAQRYINLAKSEQLAFSEQVEELPQPIHGQLTTLMHEFERRESIESIIAHDADLLECLIQAREYQTQGYTDVEDWITNCQAGLKTESAIKMAEECLSVEPREWWRSLELKQIVNGERA